MPVFALPLSRNCNGLSTAAKRCLCEQVSGYGWQGQFVNVSILSPALGVEKGGDMTAPQGALRHTGKAVQTTCVVKEFRRTLLSPRSSYTIIIFLPGMRYILQYLF